jgi:hypothetical protein
MSDQFTICFEGQDLTQAMCFVDLGAIYDYVPNIPEDTKDWFWTFTICMDRERSSDSTEVIRHVKILRDGLTAHEDILVRRLVTSDRNEIEAKALITDWVKGLEQICELAADKTTCHWVGRKTPNHVMDPTRFARGS